MWSSDILKEADFHKYIIIKGARQHNLKNIDLAIPKNKLTVITGLSGSGKSSLAFDTLFAEGQRRYVESLSSYARQFLGRMNRPDVDYINGIAPAVAIEQKVNSRNPRSTVGTSSEVYEYLKLLFARIGKTFSPISGSLVKRDTVSDVTDFIASLPTGARCMLSTRLLLSEGESLVQRLSVVLQQGYTRVSINGNILQVQQILENQVAPHPESEIFIVIDRFTGGNQEQEYLSRIADSVESAFFEGMGTCLVEYWIGDKYHRQEFSNRFEADGMSFEEPSVNLFTFNNPYGACKTCEGFGSVIGIDEDLVIPDKSLSIYEECVAPWKGEKLGEWRIQFIREARKIGFPIHRPYYELNEKEKKLLWEGSNGILGINDFFKMVEENLYKIQYRVLLSRYRGKTLCPDCKGTRLRKDAGYVKIDRYTIEDMVTKPISHLREVFAELQLNDHDFLAAKRLLQEINSRLKVICDVGLGYLTLNRLSNTLSGGESQRLNLATAIGSTLTGSMYILDEPSIGLHPRDTLQLVSVLKRLRDLGNSVIVVEHEEEIIKAADYIIDIGPGAGIHGGEIVFEGTYNELINSKDSLTADYLAGRKKIEIPARRRQWNNAIEIVGASENNLKNINVKFPLGVLTVVTGVSGSGKTTLVKQILYPALKKMYGGFAEKTGKFNRLQGEYKRIEAVELVDQNPLGRSTRSNPATYSGAYDEIRTLFSMQPLAKMRGFRPGYFSFNIEGGRCDECEGEGKVKVEMQFMADIWLVCESCKGQRFKDDVLDIKVNNLNINEILNLSIEEAIEFFSHLPQNKDIGEKIVQKIKPLADVGLGYLKLGQSTSTLSGGEAQRVKLAYFISKAHNEKKTLFIFDEPTTGLHFHDISKLLAALNALLNNGHSIIVIEHNPEIIKSADWVIDLGPEGGENGGYVVFEGTPEQLIQCEKSYTGRFLREKFKMTFNP
ncbi:MAG: excinuclease ABC subunit UvrA [Bacteroidales bacterium]|nr:excinuclease ABC subunit UvrA [Bacteroidales bacterium]